MARTIGILLAASMLGALSGSVAVAQGNGPPPETVQPGTQGAKNLGQNPNAANAINEATPSAPNMLVVPLDNITPGGVSVPDIENPVANDSNAAQRGMRYFNSFNCVGCHAANGGGGMGLALSNRAFKFGGKPAQIFTVISHGAPLGMPAWGSVLPDNVIWDIVAYIQSISDAPNPQWGTTVNAAENQPSVEQVPAEFQNTASPWQHTQGFSNGQKPTQHNPTTTGIGAKPPEAK
jgi:cytochrome c oxidase cbb3-type subunit 3